MERLGVVMEPDPDDPREAWGVLNPAAARGPDGDLYLFPRLVAEGNYSRIGRARVRFEGGRPVGVERLGVALEPEDPWEAKGVEDPRITWVPRLGLYVMAFTAYGPDGPRIAIAASADLERWERLGLARFGDGLDDVDNKDAAWLLLYHGVAGELVPGVDLQPSVRYCAGALLLDRDEVWRSRPAPGSRCSSPRRARNSTGSSRTSSFQRPSTCARTAPTTSTTGWRTRGSGSPA
jgi:predicted GH43/DUF377 family glycosyl hydrolase